MSDILDRIDALVDEQMAGGEPENGYDFDNPDYPRCWHCNRHWHGLPLTNKIANMYSWGNYDPDYSYANDDSGIICEGSDFIGPRRPTQHEQAGASWGGQQASWTVIVGEGDTFSATIHRLQERIDDISSSFFGFTAPSFEFWANQSNPWVTFYDTSWNVVVFGGRPEPEIACTGPLPEVDITFGPENWHLDFRYVPQYRQFPPMYRRVDPLSRVVGNQWRGFTAPDYPIPTSPGYDFSGYDEEITRGPKRRIDGRRA